MLPPRALVLFLACRASLSNGFQLTLSKSRSKLSVSRHVRHKPLLAPVVQLRGLHSTQASTSDRDTIRPLVLGLNKYSHDSAVCVVDANTGEVIFAGEKERLTRKKHDAGAVRGNNWFERFIT